MEKSKLNSRKNQLMESTQRNLNVNKTQAQNFYNSRSNKRADENNWLKEIQEA